MKGWQRAIDACKPKGMNVKQYNQMVHAKRRYEERFGKELTKEHYLSLVAKIQKGEATFLRRTSRRVTVWSIDDDGMEVIATYDKQRKTINTFMTPDMVKRRERKEHGEQKDPSEARHVS